MDTPKRSYTEKDTKPKKKKVPLVGKSSNTYNKISLTSQFSARIKLCGSVSGECYVWEQSGAAVEVDARDVPMLLEKKMGEKFCCGGKPNYILIRTGQ